MIMLFLLSIPIIYFFIKFVLYIIVKRYGKLSYDGFNAAGFAYDSKKDIFYSTKNAWQKNFGYTHTYNVLMPLVRMTVDTEPIKFYYNNKNWLITFWKGQYGIVTGAEVGIYCTKQQKVNKKTIYLPIKDNEMLDMEITLYKKGELITNVKSKHWWLAIFKLGMFSKPKELTMETNITFPNQEMLQAFLNSFKKLHHNKKNYRVINNTFYFKYTNPKSRKVWTRTWITDCINQFYNKKNVELYNKYLNDYIDDNEIDDSKNNNKLIMLNDLLPNLIKNNEENQNESKKIVNNILNENKKNVVLLNNNIYSSNKENKL